MVKMFFSTLLALTVYKNSSCLLLSEQNNRLCPVQWHMFHKFNYKTIQFNKIASKNASCKKKMSGLQAD